MQLISDISEMQTASLLSKKKGERIGFVPTMGCLHEGHLSLIRAARRETDVVVVSIFVNPTQFGPGEDFERYPRCLERDEPLAEKAGADILFHPCAGDLYPADFSTYVDETKLSKTLCGRTRPGHFRGVTTIVLKLFNIVLPDVAYFGQKDAQQATIIRRMARDLNLPTRIQVLPIIRENDGLAVSSRNEYLSSNERRQATVLHASLMEAQQLIRDGETESRKIKERMKERIKSAEDARIDYVSIVDRDTLEEIEKLSGNVLIALAVFVGETRLIDNLELTVPPNESRKPKE
jgi:pantoate--beta-alanine ligase